MFDAQCAKDFLLALGRDYAAAKELALTTVARRFHGDEYFFADFESGKVTITLKKYNEMVTNFRANWPAGIAWPADQEEANVDVKKRRKNR